VQKDGNGVTMTFVNGAPCAAGDPAPQTTLAFVCDATVDVGAATVTSAPKAACGALAAGAERKYVLTVPTRYACAVVKPLVCAKCDAKKDTSSCPAPETKKHALEYILVAVAAVLAVAVAALMCRKTGGSSHHRELLMA
jgi:hypothetical protein